MKLNYIFCAALFGLLLGGSRSGHADENRDVPEQLQPLITTAELVVGVNRFAFGLLKDGKLLEAADVKLRLYAIDGSESKLVAEPKVMYQTVSKLKQER